MSNRYKIYTGGLGFTALLTLLIIYFRTHPVAVLAPRGIIAAKERDLILLTSGIMLIIIIPVFILTFLIVYKYRASKKATYTPNWDGNRWLEAIWWGLPLTIITILAVITWQSSHQLDPSQTLVSNKQPVIVQVIALQYKWLFIYPEQNIASVNYLRFPAATPVSFKITSDAPMNSFWIPQLGGQVYAMSGMSMPLQLMASKAGTFRGVSANISGQGFSGMHFTAQATSDDEFQSWVKTAQHSSNILSAKTYAQLAKPSTNNSNTVYAIRYGGLYDSVIAKYLQPPSEGGNYGF